MNKCLALWTVLGLWTHFTIFSTISSTAEWDCTISSFPATSMQCILTKSEHHDYQSHTALPASLNTVALVLTARTWKLHDLGGLWKYRHF